MTTNTHTTQENQKVDTVPWTESADAVLSFRRWLEKNVSKEAGEAFQAVRVLELHANATRLSQDPDAFHAVAKARAIIKKFFS